MRKFIYSGVFVWCLTMMVHAAQAQSPVTFDVMHPHEMSAIKPCKHGFLIKNDWQLWFTRSRTESLGTVSIDYVNGKTVADGLLRNCLELGDELYLWYEDGLVILDQVTFKMRQIELKSLPVDYVNWNSTQSLDPATGYVYLNVHAPKDKMCCVVFDPAKGKIIRQIMGAWVYATADVNYCLEEGFKWSSLDKVSFKKQKTAITLNDTEEIKTEGISALVSHRMVWIPERSMLAFIRFRRPMIYSLAKGEVNRIGSSAPQVDSYHFDGRGADSDGYLALGASSNGRATFLRLNLDDPSQVIEDVFDHFDAKSDCREASHMIWWWYDHYRNQWLARGNYIECYTHHLPAIERNRLKNAQVREQQIALQLSSEVTDADASALGFIRHYDREGLNLPSRSTRRLDIASPCTVNHGIYSNEDKQLLYLFYDSLIYVYNKSAGKLMHTYGYPAGTKWRVHQIAGDRFALFNSLNEVYVYDLSSGECQVAFSVHWEYVLAAVGHRSALVAINRTTGKHFMLNLLTGTIVRSGQLNDFPGGVRLLTVSNSLNAYYFLSSNGDLHKYHAVSGQRIFKRDVWIREITAIAAYTNDDYFFTVLDNPSARFAGSAEYAESMSSRPIERCEASSVFFVSHRPSGYTYLISGVKGLPKSGGLEFVPSIKESGITILDNHGVGSDERYYYFSAVANGQFVVYAYDTEREVLADWYVLEGDVNRSPGLASLKGRDLYYDGEGERQEAWDARMEAHRLEVLREREAYNAWLISLREHEKVAEEQAAKDRAQKEAEDAAAEVASYRNGVVTFEALSPSGTIAVVTAQVQYVLVQEKDLLFNRYNWVRHVKTYDIQRFHFKNNPSNVFSSSSGDGVWPCDNEWSGDCVILNGFIYRLYSNTVKFIN